MENLNSPYDSRSLIVSSFDLTEEEIGKFKSLALTVAESSSYCLFEIGKDEFEVHQALRTFNLDPFLGPGSVLALIVAMSVAVEFTPFALLLLIISYLMPDTSILIVNAIKRKFKKPIMLDPATVSLHSSKKSILVQKARQFGFVTKYTLMPNNRLRIVLQLPEESSAFLPMLE